MQAKAIQLGLLQLNTSTGAYIQVTKDGTKETLFQVDAWNDFFDDVFFDFVQGKGGSLTFVDLRAKAPTDDVAAEVQTQVDAYKRANLDQLPALVVQVFADPNYDSAVVNQCFQDRKAAYDARMQAKTVHVSPPDSPRVAPQHGQPPPPAVEDPATIQAKKDAARRYRKSLIQTLSSKWTYLNPTVGALITALSVIMGGLFAAFAPATLLAAASPWLMGIAALGVLYTTIAFVPYVIHECYQHFNAWRFDAWRNWENSVDGSKPNERKTYAEYLNAVHGVAQTEDDAAIPPDLNMPGFADYFTSLHKQFGEWISQNKVTFAITLVGLIVSGFLLGGAVAFFMGNPLIAPVFTAMSTFIAGAFQAIGTAIPGFGFLADLAAMTQAVDIISAVLMITIPLTLANVFRLIARADDQALLAGGTNLPRAPHDRTTPNGFDPASDNVSENLSDEFRASIASGRLYDEFSASSKAVWAKVEKTVNDGVSDVFAAAPLTHEKPSTN